MTDAVRRGRGRPRDPGADSAILTAALDLFIERGVEGTSIEQVAKRAGVGKLTVYRRWSSKEELIAQAIESARGDIPQPSLADVEGIPLAELIEHALPALTETLAAPRFRALIARVFGSSVSHPKLMATYWEHYIQPRRQATGVLLERAKQDGVLAKDTDNEVLIDMMVGAVTYRLLRPEPLDRAGMRRYLEGVYQQAGLLPGAVRSAPTRTTRTTRTSRP